MTQVMEGLMTMEAADRNGARGRKAPTQVVAVGYARGRMP